MQLLVGVNLTESQIENSTLSTSYDVYIKQRIVEITVIYLCLFPLIVCFGISGNILTVTMLFKETETSTTVIYLKHLALVDLFTLTIKGAIAVCVWWQLFRPEQYLTWKVNTFTLNQLTYFSEKISKYITMGIVFERIVAVTWPFKIKDICTPTRTRITVGVIYAVILAVSVPFIVDVFIFFNNTDTGNQGYPSVFAEGKNYFISRLTNDKALIITFLINRTIHFLPVPLIIIGNMVIIAGLRKKDIVKSSSVGENKHRKRQERQVTKMCLIISVTFLCLCGPQDISAFILFIQGMQVNNTTRFTIEILATLTLMNSAVNFVVYAVMSTKYRQGYVDILTCGRRQPVLHNEQQYTRDNTQNKEQQYTRDSTQNKEQQYTRDSIQNKEQQYTRDIRVL